MGLLVGQVLASPLASASSGMLKKREKRGECQVPGPYPFPVPPVHQPDERSQKKGKERPSSSGEKIQVGQEFPGMMHGLSLAFFQGSKCVREMSIDLSGQPHERGEPQL